MLSDSGRIFYVDDHKTIYRSEWTTTNRVLDITTVISQPFVWGQSNKGYIENGTIYRLGIITVERAVIRILDDGYEIIADGTSQYVDYIQTTFPCQERPSDNFRYHLNCGLSEVCEHEVTDGSHWADEDDESAIWAEVDVDGSIIAGTTTENPLTWEDVWSE